MKEIVTTAAYITNCVQGLPEPVIRWHRPGMAALALALMVNVGNIGDIGRSLQPRTGTMIVAASPAGGPQPVGLVQTITLPVRAISLVSMAAQPSPLAPALLARTTALAMNAKIAFDPTPGAVAKAFYFSGDTIQKERATECLAQAVWYEAGASADGQRAVAQVVLNRVRHVAFPNTVCGVVFQGSERKTGCQFTFTCDGALQARTPGGKSWDLARQTAAAALNGSVFEKVGLATHYHTDWVHPVWSDKLSKIAAVQTHLFFRFPGRFGQPVSFRLANDGPEQDIQNRALTRAGSVGAPSQAIGQTIANAALPSLGRASIQAGVAANSVPLAAPDPSPPSVLDLKGNRLLLSSVDRNRFVMQLNSAAPGSFALAALRLCRGKDSCEVYGWKQQAGLPRDVPSNIASAKKPSFYFGRLKRQRLDQTLWDCREFQRPDPSQCLVGTL